VIFLQSLPGFWIGTMLIYFAAIKWRLLPGFGYVGVKSTVLPAIALAATFVPILARGTRHAVAEIMRRDFVVNLRARGIPVRLIVRRHLLRHLGVPLITLIGAQLGLMLGATFIIEYIFNYPGIGKFGVDSVLTRDLPATQGVVMAIATIVIATNLLVDLSYFVLDPRLRRGGS
jgi:peptide/nickel transport system permease protein